MFSWSLDLYEGQENKQVNYNGLLIVVSAMLS